MPENLNLKQIEKKAYLSYHEDGVLDLTLGSVFLLICFTWVLFGLFNILTWPSLILMAIFYPVYISAKQKITVPRFGYFKFGKERKERNINTFEHFIFYSICVQILTGPLLLLLGYLGLKIFMVTYLFILIAATFALVAYWQQLYRFYFYAIFTLILGFIIPVFKIPPQYNIGLFTLVFSIPFCYGSIMLKSFTQKYPKVSEELSNV
jgi:hypothetical protein